MSTGMTLSKEATFIVYSTNIRYEAIRLYFFGQSMILIFQAHLEVEIVD